MAHQTVVLMKRQRHITVGTLDGLSAGTAGHKVGIAPPVDEHHDLFLFLQTVTDHLLKPSAENGLIPSL